MSCVGPGHADGLHMLFAERLLHINIIPYRDYDYMVAVVIRLFARSCVVINRHPQKHSLISVIIGVSY